MNASPASRATPRARSAATTSARSKPARVRPRDLGHRAPGRAGLSHRLQSAACARAEGPMILSPGSVPLGAWRAIARGEAFSLDPAALPAVAASAAAVDGDRRRRQAGLRHQHRLRKARERAHRAGRARPASAQHRALACGRRRRADEPRERAADDGAEAREPRARRVGRAAADARLHAADARPRRDAGGAEARLGRRVGRPRAARAHDRRDARRRRGLLRRASACRPPRRSRARS